MPSTSAHHTVGKPAPVRSRRPVNPLSKPSRIFLLRMLHQRALAGDADAVRVLIQLGDSADRNARRKRHAAKRAKKSRDAKKSAPAE